MLLAVRVVLVPSERNVCAWPTKVVPWGRAPLAAAALVAVIMPSIWRIMLSICGRRFVAVGVGWECEVVKGDQLAQYRVNSVIALVTAE